LCRQDLLKIPFCRARDHYLCHKFPAFRLACLQAASRRAEEDGGYVPLARNPFYYFSISFRPFAGTLKKASFVQTFPPVETLLPHRPPAVVVDRIVAYEKETIRCERKVRPNEHYGPGLSAEGIVEFCAQTAILCEAMGSGRSIRHGALASIDDFVFSRQASVGDVLVAEIQVKTRLGNLALFECAVTCDGSAVAHGFLKAAQS
jgi:predicted hotdog family 3-hydroxylacyl-ACP dehydratase